jgi:hypothetical protein
MKVLGIWPHRDGVMMGMAQVEGDEMPLYEDVLEKLARDLSKEAPDLPPTFGEVELTIRKFTLEGKVYTIWFNAKSEGELNRIVVGFLTNMVDPTTFAASRYAIRGPVLITGEDHDGDRVEFLTDSDVERISLSFIQNDLSQALRGMSRKNN